MERSEMMGRSEYGVKGEEKIRGICAITSRDEISIWAYIVEFSDLTLSYEPQTPAYLHQSNTTK